MRLRELYSLLYEHSHCKKGSPCSIRVQQQLDSMDTVDRNDSSIMTYHRGCEGSCILELCERHEAQYGTIGDGAVVRILD